MTSEKDILLRELIEIPERIHKGDFVVNLADGVERPEETLRNYVITEQLAGAFEKSLGFVRSGLEGKSSKAAYLHGSFGSGKSHFMAVLHLLLSGNVQAWSRPELAAVRGRHRWLDGKKFLLVPYHMIGKPGLASAVLSGYADRVAVLHPGSPHPGIYRSDDLFANARDLRESMGDAKFFEKLNRSAGGSQWGALGRGWTAPTFEAALKEKPGSPERVRLTGDLVEHLFPALKGLAQGKDEALVELDEGLGIISQHAKALGYDALILFLDELILWLASHSADRDFMQRQGQLLTKLVESQRSDRPAPIVSFIARQKDLRELVGEKVTGAERLNFADILGHWEGRFEKITLEDRNLAAIVEKRLLRPKEAAARERIERSFEDTTKIRAEVMEVLLTREGDRGQFRQLYPFSPALIEALVGVSGALQRERTALYILSDILVKKRDTLKLGEVVPVGDLWDFLAHEDQPFDESMRKLFRIADRLYRERLKPLAESPADERILKTLLIAALVPGVPSLKDLTPARLAALNHGTILSPIPGREAQVVLGKLQSWAPRVAGSFQISKDPLNPTVSLLLSDVDVEGIILAAGTYDNQGARLRKVREMVFDSLGIEEDQEKHTHDLEVTWRGTTRTCNLLGANVRELNDESFRMKDDGWKLIIDYPYDSEGHGALEDLTRVEKFRASGQSERTLAWLPSFLSMGAQRDLGRLIITEKLLTADNLAQFSPHLSSADREEAKKRLENLRVSLQRQMRDVLEEAYGLRPARPGSLDSSNDLAGEHFQSLYQSLELRPPAAADFRSALDQLLDQALAFQFPAHPEFERTVKSGELKKVLDIALQAVSVDPARVPVDAALRPILKQIANPLDLGKMSETHFVPGSFWKDHFLRMAAQEKKTRPSVADLRGWMDEPKARGLPSAVQDLVILVYAAQTNRSFHLHGGPYQPAVDNMPDELELREEPLPSPEDWSRALKLGQEVLGIAIAPVLNASNARHFAEQVRAGIDPLRGGAQRLPDLLRTCMEGLDLKPKDHERMRTAVAVAALVAGLDGSGEPADLVARLARAAVATSGPAMGTSLKSVEVVCRTLQDIHWGLFQNLRKIQDARKIEARNLLDDVAQALTADEHVVSVREKLKRAEERAIALLEPPAAQPAPEAKAEERRPPPGWKAIESGKKERIDSSSFKSQSEEIARRLRADTGLRVDLSWTFLREEDR